MSTAAPSKQRAKKKLFKIDALIEAKALKSGKKVSILREEARKVIKVSDRQFRNIRTAKQNTSGYLTTDQLLALAKHFDVGIDDLINH